MPAWLLDWLPLALVIGVIAGVLVYLFRSFRRWKIPPATTPEAKAAEARLWSTRSMDQR
ncbi:MAG TPA: hypothetical protein VFH75_00990 [Actinomycetota bacterium]|nr:hypothetical protein [Actinomycetota bacterium]